MKLYGRVYLPGLLSSARILLTLIPGFSFILMIHHGIEWYRPDIIDKEHRVTDKGIYEIHDHYDFIIIGGGSAGTVLANRLSEHPKWKILLLEAGDDEHILADVPFLSPTLQLTDMDWQFTTEPDHKYCLSMKDGVCNWPRGKTLGGSSSINAMLYVRGNKRDYDYWEELGNHGWSFEKVLPYFKKAEDIQIPELKDDYFHGNKGYLTIEHFRFRHKIADSFLEAGKELGYETIDVNGKQQTGFGYSQGTLRDGLRCSTSKAYIRSASKRKNLHVSLKSHVKKILIDEHTKKANGVIFNKYGYDKEVYATKEVILSAGSIQSPQILMLSGVGKVEELEHHGIKPLVDSRGVGENLQDHVAIGGSPYLLDEEKGKHVTFHIDSGFQKETVDDFLYKHKGLLYNLPECEVMAFINTIYGNYSDDWPDVQLFLTSFADNTDGGVFGKRMVGLSDDMYAEMFEKIIFKPAYYAIPLLLRPKSRGVIKLKNKDPYSKPLIYPNYFSHPDDMKVLIEGARFADAISRTYAMQKLGAHAFIHHIPGCEHVNDPKQDYDERLYRSKHNPGSNDDETYAESAKRESLKFNETNLKQDNVTNDNKKYIQSTKRESLKLNETNDAKTYAERKKREILKSNQMEDNDKSYTESKRRESLALNEMESITEEEENGKERKKHKHSHKKSDGLDEHHVPKDNLMSSEYLDCRARHHTLTIYHPVGTCKMGTPDDQNAVVDPRLKVYGVKGLRVVDASIMPVIVSGNTNAPVVMIAEKAADMIKEDWLAGVRFIHPSSKNPFQPHGSNSGYQQGDLELQQFSFSHPDQFSYSPGFQADNFVPNPTGTANYLNQFSPYPSQGTNLGFNDVLPNFGSNDFSYDNVGPSNNPNFFLNQLNPVQNHEQNLGFNNGIPSYESNDFGYDTVGPSYNDPNLFPNQFNPGQNHGQVLDSLHGIPSHEINMEPIFDDQSSLFNEFQQNQEMGYLGNFEQNAPFFELPPKHFEQNLQSNGPSPVYSSQEIADSSFEANHPNQDVFVPNFHGPDLTFDNLEFYQQGPNIPYQEFPQNNHIQNHIGVEGLNLYKNEYFIQNQHEQNMVVQDEVNPLNENLSHEFSPNLNPIIPTLDQEEYLKPYTGIQDQNNDASLKSQEENLVNIVPSNSVEQILLNTDKENENFNQVLPEYETEVPDRYEQKLPTEDNQNSYESQDKHIDEGQNLGNLIEDHQNKVPISPFVQGNGINENQIKDSDINEGFQDVTSPSQQNVTYSFVLPEDANAHSSPGSDGVSELIEKAEDDPKLHGNLHINNGEDNELTESNNFVKEDLTPLIPKPAELSNQQNPVEAINQNYYTEEDQGYSNGIVNNLELGKGADNLISHEDRPVDLNKEVAVDSSSIQNVPIETTVEKPDQDLIDEASHHLVDDIHEPTDFNAYSVTPVTLVTVGYNLGYDPTSEHVQIIDEVPQIYDPNVEYGLGIKNQTPENIAQPDGGQDILNHEHLEALFHQEVQETDHEESKTVDIPHRTLINHGNPTDVNAHSNAAETTNDHKINGLDHVTLQIDQGVPEASGQEYGSNGIVNIAPTNLIGQNRPNYNDKLITFQHSEPPKQIYYDNTKVDEEIVPLAPSNPEHKKIDPLPQQSVETYPMYFNNFGTNYNHELLSKESIERYGTQSVVAVASAPIIQEIRYDDVPNYHFNVVVKTPILQTGDVFSSDYWNDLRWSKIKLNRK